MWKSSIQNMEKYFEVFRSVQMDIMLSHDTDFQSADGNEIKLLPQLWWLIREKDDSFWASCKISLSLMKSSILDNL